MGESIFTHVYGVRARCGFQLLGGLLLAGLCAGCGPLVYGLTSLQSEMILLGAAVPIETAINDPALSQEHREKLAFIMRAREYASEMVGLNVGDSYSTFVDLKGHALSWNLSASRTDRFESYRWEFLGSTPYLVFFDWDQAAAERDRLIEEGYDTVIYEVDAYSTYGILPDPVASSLLDRDLVSLADTIMHETLHNTVFRLGDSQFNESMASFVGRTAGIEFLEFEFGADASIVQEARLSYQDIDRLNVFLQALIVELNAIYESDLSSDEIWSARKQAFSSAKDRFGREILPLMHEQDRYGVFADSEMNNAFLLLNVRYNTDLDVFEKVYELTGRDWTQTLNLFAQAADDDDPLGFLRGLVDSSSSQSNEGKRAVPALGPAAFFSIGSVCPATLAAELASY